MKPNSSFDMVGRDVAEQKAITEHKVRKMKIRDKNLEKNAFNSQEKKVKDRIFERTTDQNRLKRKCSWDYEHDKVL